MSLGTSRLCQLGTQPQPQLWITLRLQETLHLQTVVGYISPAPVEYAAPASVEDNIAPSPEVCSVAPAPVDCYMALALALHAIPAPVVEYIALAPIVGAAPVTVVEDFAPAPAVFYAAPALVGEYMAPTPAIAVCEGCTFCRATGRCEHGLSPEFH